MMEPLLREHVEKALEIDNLRTAIFLGERLCVESDSEENVILLGKCYIRNRQDYRAVEVLKKVKQLSAAGLLLRAQCLYRMDSQDTETVIEAAKVQAERQAKDTHEQSNERLILAEIYYLHGLLCKKKAEFEKAIKNFKLALEQNPLLWSAFEEVCNLGGNKEVNTHLKKIKEKFGVDTDRMEIYEDTISDVSAGKATLFAEATRSMEEPSDPHSHQYHSFVGDLISSSTDRLSISETRQCNTSPKTPARSKATQGGSKTPTKQKPTSNSRRRQSSGRPSHERAVNNPAGPDPVLVDGSPSTGNTYFSASEQNSGEGLNAVSRQTSLGVENEGFTNTNPNTNTTETRQPNTTDGAKDLYRFIYTLSKGYHAYSCFTTDPAVQILQRLPERHQNTSWIASKLGCLAMQKANYEKAREMFKKARELDPTYIEDMDLYSSVLFLLDDSPTLNVLAKELTDLDRLAPQTWCAVGNLHSSQRDHRTALDAFKRAIQMDQTRPYSYTLCGHTLLALEDHVKARNYFRQAIDLDRRHHFGWYGLGLVEFHAENFTAAALGFERAIEINPLQSVFRLQYGRSLAKIGKSDEAKQELIESRSLDNKNKAACLELGKLYFDHTKYKDAKTMFQSAWSIDANDPAVFYHLGLTYKRLNDKIAASNALLRALDLNPPSVLEANIKAALDKIDQNDDDPHRKY